MYNNRISNEPLQYSHTFLIHNVFEHTMNNYYTLMCFKATIHGATLLHATRSVKHVA